MCHAMWHATSARESERELTRERNSISFLQNIQLFLTLGDHSVIPSCPSLETVETLLDTLTLFGFDYKLFITYGFESPRKKIKFEIELFINRWATIYNSFVKQVHTFYCWENCSNAKITERSGLAKFFIHYCYFLYLLFLSLSFLYLCCNNA